jgi:hypothetical protein
MARHRRPLSSSGPLTAWAEIPSEAAEEAGSATKEGPAPREELDMVDEDSTTLDRVLTTRLESVRQTLLDLRNLSDDVKNARRGLDDLSDHITQMGVSLASAVRQIGNVQSEIASFAENARLYQQTGNAHFLAGADDLDQQAERLIGLRTKLADLQTSLTIETGRAVTTMRRWSPLASSGSDLSMTVKRLANDLTAVVALTESKPDPWTYYQSVVRSECEELFAQYVDLVGGIAMRDHGLDRAVSPLADHLVNELLMAFSGPLTTLAVPSRHGSGPLIHTQHVRIPLPPGWTPWTLPLIARGIGELLVQSLDMEDEPRADVMPDVFGVYVCGPAYALASVLIELDPSEPRDRRRGQTILNTLRAVDDRGEGDDAQSYSMLADELAADWEQAVSAVDGLPEGGGGPAGDDGEDDGGAPANLSQVVDLVAQSCSDGAYLPEDRWQSVRTLAAALAGDPADAAPLDMRDVLNAMWLARWRNPRSLKRIEPSAQEAARIVMTRGTTTPLHPLTRPGRPI